MTEGTSSPPQVVNAWKVIQGFMDAVDICECGTVEKALRHIHQELARYPTSEAGSYRPAEQGDVFAAYVLDSWDLVTHGGSIDAGAWRTEKGDALYRAMAALGDADEGLLPGFGDAQGDERETSAWWTLGEDGAQ